MINKLKKPGDYYIFTEDQLTVNYYDAENDLPDTLFILNKPVYGVFTFNNKPIYKYPYQLNLSDLDKLKYVRINRNEYTETINIKIGDNNQNNLNSDMATFTINVEQYENLPPTIGDGEITIGNQEIKILTVEDFTTATTPVYSDPEGDAPYKLKILSLPLIGSLAYDGNPVSLNQEILFTDIQLGLLTITGDKSDLDAYELSFDFAISDVGSQQFSE